MATFPELEPATREYTFGIFPLTEEPSPSAGIIRFRHGTISTAYQLTLGYVYLTDTEANLIRTHYGVQGGGNISFVLPSAIWRGHTFSGNIAPVGTRWRYTTPPEEQQLNAGYVNVSIALESDGQINSNPDSVRATLVTGIAGGGGSGFALTVTASLVAGAATGA